MKVIALSDLHGKLIDITTPFDLMLICGDICPDTNHSIAYQEFWLKTYFKKWLNSLPYKDITSKVVFIAGNHDFWFERNGSSKLGLDLIDLPSRAIYLHHDICSVSIWDNEKETLTTLSIFGSPYCTEYGNWAFMHDDEFLQRKYSQIPDFIDIFISHGAPYMNGLGTITEGRQGGGEAGSIVLAEAVSRIRPKYFFCGHIHSGNHALCRRVFADTEREMYSANVSISGEMNRERFKPLIFDYRE